MDVMLILRRYASPVGAIGASLVNNDVRDWISIMTSEERATVGRNEAVFTFSVDPARKSTDGAEMGRRHTYPW